ncbi:13062_t:CDS:1, partial [Acaulospora morrowiae]
MRHQYHEDGSMRSYRRRFAAFPPDGSSLRVRQNLIRQIESD